ncbi:hypothetical protein [Actinoplanes philippinensis]|uniref:hypothetical protein n=1 Tax=Actinoplanes philippinensis TaxID=35752 RepID=UPI0033F22FC5
MIDLQSVDRDAVIYCYTAREVFAKAEAVARTGTDRDVLTYLVQTGVNLSAMACRLSEAYTEDSHDLTTAVQAGLYPHRNKVLASAATCAFNAALFLQEAQRRRARRSSGYDPLIAPQHA